MAATAGCDRRSAPGQQANETAPAPAAPAAAAARAPDRSHRGEPAPAIAFQDPAGKPVTLASFRGTPVLLNLWATWCAPCVKEMPTLDRLAALRGERLRVLPVSQDLDGTEKVAAFFARSRFRALQPYLDKDAAFSIQMGLNLPTTILYDSDGREVWRMLGDFDWSSNAAIALIDEAK